MTTTVESADDTDSEVRDLPAEDNETVDSSQSEEVEDGDEPDELGLCPFCDTRTVKEVEEVGEDICYLCHTSPNGVFYPTYDIDQDDQEDGSETNLTVYGLPHEQPSDEREEYKHTKDPIKYGAFVDVPHVRPYADT